MKPFNAMLFFLIARSLTHYTNRYNVEYVLTEEDRQDLLRAFPSNVIASMKFHDFKGGLSACESLTDFVKGQSVTNGGHVRIHVEAILTALRYDLEREKFFQMPALEALRYKLKEPFGNVVATAFPSTLYDSQEAGNCYACGRYTACVFHCMRVLEYGLRSFLTSAFPSIPVPANPNWGVILQQIESAIAALPSGNAKRQPYSDLATNFKIFKDGWRNNASHIGSKYDEFEADSIYRHVDRFMQGLSKQGFHE